MRKKLYKKIIITILTLCAALCMTLFGCGNDKEPEKNYFENLVFTNKVVTYDGNEHDIKVENVPDFATVKYVYELKGEPVEYMADAGEYDVYATVSADGYVNANLSAVLKIKEATMTGVTLGDASVYYDGTDKTSGNIRVNNLPAGAQAYYSFYFNGDKVDEVVDVGRYDVLATVIRKNYKTLYLNATLTVKSLDFTNITFNNDEFTYDGTAKTLSVVGAPEGTDITYSYEKDGLPVTSAISAGAYTVTATLTKKGYNTQRFTATLTITKPELRNFTGVAFADADFDYDGTAKTLAVVGAPEGTGVTYVYKKGGAVVTAAVSAGVYEVTATLKKDGYNDKTLTAKLTINYLTFDGITFEDKTFEYDGTEKYITADGIPDFAFVTYVYRTQGIKTESATEAGEYFVTLTVSADNYITLTLNATLTITEPVKKEFSNASVSNKTVEYDGRAKTLTVSGLPGGTNVIFSYTKNGERVDSAVETGRYSVTVILEKTGYNTKTLTAVLTIIPTNFKGVTFADASVDYDGMAKTLEAEGIPGGATVTYTYYFNGESVDSAIGVGKYTVVLVIEKENYNRAELTATLTVKTASMKGLSFEDEEVDYDGNAHYLTVVGAPDGATITYAYSLNGTTVDSAIKAGSYRVAAFISCDGYFTKSLVATLTIVPLNFKGITMKDATFAYDGSNRYLTINGIPDGATSRVLYYLNGAITDNTSNVGTYTVRLIVNKEGYVEYTATAVMTITPLTFEGLAFKSKTVTYDGTAKTIILSGFPDGATVAYVYKKNGTKVASAIETGTYRVEATVTKTGYKTVTLIATLSIVEQFDNSWYGESDGNVEVSKVSGTTIVGDINYDFGSAEDLGADAVKGRAGKYIKFATSGAENALVNVHSNNNKSYYEELSGMGYVLSFYYYSDVTTHLSFVGYYNYSTKLNVKEIEIPAGKWCVISLPFDGYILATDEASSTGHYLDFENLGTGADLNTAMLNVKTSAPGTVIVGHVKIEEMQPEITNGREPALDNIVWNDVSEIDFEIRNSAYGSDTAIIGEKAYQLIDAGKITDSTDVLYGKTGLYAKVYSSSAENVFYNLFAKDGYDKSYYTDILKGKHYVLSFDFYSSANFNAKFVGYTDYNLSKGLTVGQKTVAGGKWITVSISFDNFILATDSSSLSGRYLDFGYPQKADLNSNLFGAMLMGGTTTYAGNFRIEQNPDMIAQRSGVTIDMNGGLSYNFTDLLTAAEKKTVNDYKKGGTTFTWVVGYADGTSEFIEGASDTFYVTKNNYEKIKDKVVSVSAKCDDFSADGVLRSNSLIYLTNVSLDNLGDLVTVSLSAASSLVKILKTEDTTGKLVDGSTVEITAFRNEYESAQFIIGATKNVSVYSVTAKDLTCGKEVLSKDNIELFHQAYQKMTVPLSPYYTTEKGYYPDALIPMETAVEKGITSVKAGENQGVWITVNIPKDQKAGVYTGDLEITVDGAKTSVPLKVTVYDYTLSDETHSKTKFSLSYNAIATYYPENTITTINGEMMSSVNKEILDAYYKYFANYRISLGGYLTPIASRGYYGWNGRPYSTEKLFSVRKITINGKLSNESDYPLIGIDENNKITSYTDRSPELRTAYIDLYVEEMAKRAADGRISSYGVPVVMTNAVYPDYNNIINIYGDIGYGSWTEYHTDIPMGEKLAVIDQYHLREVVERMYLKSVEKHTDLFKKASIYVSWIDEFTGNEWKTTHAKYIFKYYAEFIENVSNWLTWKYSVSDAFSLSLIESIKGVRIISTAEHMDGFSATENPALFCPIIEHYDSEKERKAILKWAKDCYGDNFEQWTYLALSPVSPYPNIHTEDTPLSGRLLGWMMYDYDITGLLYWSTMATTYQDNCYKRDENGNIVKDSDGNPIILDGETISIKDYYEKSIHYGSVPGDGFLIYPGIYYGLNKPVGSIRLEAIRDAIEDYEVLYALEEFYNARAKIRDEESGFDSVMARLKDGLYSGTRTNVSDGGDGIFATARNALASMIVLAEKYGVIIEKAEVKTSGVTFTVSAPVGIDLSDSGLEYSYTTPDGEYKVYTATATGEEFVFGYDGNYVTLSMASLEFEKEVSSLEWTGANSTDYVVYNGSKVGSGVTVEKTTLFENALGENQAGTYYKVTPNSSSNKNMIGFTLRSSHNKSYYEAYRDTASLAFDVYIDVKDQYGKGIVDYRLYYSFGYSNNRQMQTNRTFFTVYIPLSKVLDNWDAIKNSGKAVPSAWALTDRALFSLNGGAHNDGTETATYYIGNFRIEKNC